MQDGRKRKKVAGGSQVLGGEVKKLSRVEEKLECPGEIPAQKVSPKLLRHRDAKRDAIKPSQDPRSGARRQPCCACRRQGCAGKEIAVNGGRQLELLVLLAAQQVFLLLFGVSSLVCKAAVWSGSAAGHIHRRRLASPPRSHYST